MKNNMRIYMSEDISTVDGAKVVQTEVPMDVYERFTRAASARGLTIKEAAKAAIEGYADIHQPIDPDDPLFAPLDREPGVADDGDDVSERVDEVVYGTTDDDRA